MAFIVTLVALILISVPAWAQAAADLSPQDFIAQVLVAVKALGGATVMAKISSIVLLIVASMKVSFLNQLIWSKLGKLQIWVGPILGLLAGIIGGGPLSLASVFAYMSAGAGAVFLHEILDLVKAIPGLGAIYVSIIDVVAGLLGGPKSGA